MADLQDTNAATEEIYGPLLIVDCPVSDEMISQSSGLMAASDRKSPFPCAGHYLLIRCFGWKPYQEERPGNNGTVVNMTKTRENKCERESETVGVNQGHEKSGFVHPRASADEVHSHLHGLRMTFTKAHHLQKPKRNTVAMFVGRKLPLLLH